MFVFLPHGSLPEKNGCFLTIYFRLGGRDFHSLGSLPEKFGYLTAMN